MSQTIIIVAGLVTFAVVMLVSEVLSARRFARMRSSLEHGHQRHHDHARGLRQSADRLRTIDAVISDVDGVLTDGGIVRFADGTGGRVFNCKDGLGHTLLRQAGVKLAWISSTKERGSLEVRGQDLKVTVINTDPGPKDERLFRVCAQLGVEPARCAFIGDDLIDLSVLEHVGLFACPADAVPKVREVAHLVLEAPGGRGAFRELADLVLAHRPNRTAEEIEHRVEAVGVEST
ncbi:MAG: HAD hydrolase family protein [Planctomycetota bacterium]